ncbi:MAG: c-type cytochrome [Blastocatellia bacterium]
MKRYAIVLTVALLMLAPFVRSASQTQEKPKEDAAAQEKTKGDAAAGKDLYLASCKKCHGLQGEGVPRMYKLVKAKLVHLGSKEAQDKSDAEIRKSMTDGFGKMEAIKDPRPLTAVELDNIVAFVRTLKQ